jgi:hypothetical protein
MLPVGTDTISATVTDSGGRSTTRSLTVHITQRPITVQITNPVNGYGFVFGQTINFTGYTHDPLLFGPVPDANLHWLCTDDVGGSTVACPGTGGGVFATGSTASLSASTIGVGPHRISFMNDDQLECIFGACGADPAMDAIEITVSAPTGNVPPTAFISIPASDGQFFYDNGQCPFGPTRCATVTLQGSGTDPEDGTITNPASFTWTVSDSSGPLSTFNGTSPSFSFPITDCFGTQYTVSLTVVDSGGAVSVPFTRRLWAAEPLC